MKQISSSVRIVETAHHRLLQAKKDGMWVTVMSEHKSKRPLPKGVKIVGSA